MIAAAGTGEIDRLHEAASRAGALRNSVDLAKPIEKAPRRTPLGFLADEIRL
jgi:hypothetical protein